jgi:hypothetical protein
LGFKARRDDIALSGALTIRSRGSSFDCDAAASSGELRIFKDGGIRRRQSIEYFLLIEWDKRSVVIFLY